MLLSSDKLAL